MRLMWITLFASAATVFASRSPEVKQDIATENITINELQINALPVSLPDLLTLVKVECSMIGEWPRGPTCGFHTASNTCTDGQIITDAILTRYEEAHDISQKKAARQVGRRLKRMTKSMARAKLFLEKTGQHAFDEAATLNGCDHACMTRYTKAIIKELSVTTRAAILKLGLQALGKRIQPVFIALSGLVITVNGLVGGTLVFITTLVNALLLAIAAGIAFLGHLVSDTERAKAGGPGGPKTAEIANLLDGLGWVVDQ
ncbi:hypothetical protein M406DRAFT_69289 [Cryphonectria parasitica EP155]|uniref:Uncharacterized protein n=1 Tax=Cryphonectria parasitica (strain ATCC 38755 / EP155) TaxID=660469 RepID=A0A9P4Y5Z6_CRYP1|nr:uncharacterized protein M406DRAFT_69289 [Cryphonectria parasitica EP155]KAF3767125.1 hypothetical protein M406DRAFT_69289 [Cryphonectria parasitica EP155]